MVMEVGITGGCQLAKKGQEGTLAIGLLAMF